MILQVSVACGSLLRMLNEMTCREGGMLFSFLYLSHPLSLMGNVKWNPLFNLLSDSGLIPIPVTFSVLPREFSELINSVFIMLIWLSSEPVFISALPDRRTELVTSKELNEETGPNESMYNSNNVTSRMLRERL